MVKMWQVQFFFETRAFWRLCSPAEVGTEHPSEGSTRPALEQLLPPPAPHAQLAKQSPQKSGLRPWVCSGCAGEGSAFRQAEEAPL